MKRIGNFKIILWLIIVFLIAGNVGVMKASANTPRVIIENYQIVEGSIEPGGKVILSLQLKNTSNSQDVYNTLLTYANVENMIMSSEKSNQIFVNSIKAGKETTITFELEISKEFSANSIFIDFNLDYVTANGEKLGNSAKIALKKDDCILSVGEVSINDAVELEMPTVLSFDYANIGDKDIYDITMKLDGNIEEEEKTVEIGNISAGQKKTFDYNFYLTEEGTQKVNVSFEYKDSKGTIKTIEEKEYMVNVNKADDISNNKEQSKKGISGQQIVIFCVGIFFIVVILFVEFKIIKRREQL